jgi:hypothetical protein
MCTEGPSSDRADQAGQNANHDARGLYDSLTHGRFSPCYRLLFGSAMGRWVRGDISANAPTEIDVQRAASEC